MMHRKDYRLIAAAFYQTRPNPVNPRGVWNTSLNFLADELARENPRFDKDKFIDAAEGVVL